MEQREFLEQVLSRRLDRIRDGDESAAAGFRHSSLQQRFQDPQVVEVVKRARETVRDIPDVRRDKVAWIRQAMTEGSLPMDGKTLAGRMLQESLLNELL